MINIELSKLRKLKVDYYMGKLDKQQLDQLGWAPMQWVIRHSSDLQIYMDADADLNKMIAKRALHEEAVNFCQMVCKQTSDRTWQIKAAIDWEKFAGGQ
jgi:hypothetical protein